MAGDLQRNRLYLLKMVAISTAYAFVSNGLMLLSIVQVCERSTSGDCSVCKFLRYYLSQIHTDGLKDIKSKKS